MIPDKKSDSAPSCRLLTKDNGGALRELRLKAVKEETRSFMESYEEAEAQAAHRYFTNGWVAGAWNGENLVGMAGLYRHSGAKVMHKGTIWGVYVIPEFRGQGLSRRLIEIVIAEAKKAGLELLHISTDVTNQHTQEIYKGLGFTPYGVEEHIIKLADGSYVDDVWMMKFLK